eukprot:CAMPEP_0183311086 /NCGR_PEP_ID=MMETSP0160_2-20130417/35118_1 /TAXON_ID=2839 ORGANISM="Odontella Sinensis, Strain Grunow 1884" /NCGR_SAMPLE_ID=MMETSP0160_2 /ASSEMBLY_ACC=CAM_ASM_000250 /LENGTH=795 /DNA_ID=CAMNT_0025475563 /DNA_START=112 /DNA_END=2499 /DNA_ORIENTATION=-
MSAKFVLTGTAEELTSYRALKVLAAATYTSTLLDRKVLPSAADVSAATTPLAKAMALTLPDGTTHVGGSSNSMARAVSSHSPGCKLGAGTGSTDSALVDSWTQFGWTDIEVPVSALKRAKAAGVEAGTEQVKSDLAKALGVLDAQLKASTYLVGQGITLADIGLCAALTEAAEAGLWDPTYEDGKSEGELLNVRRWFDSITNQALFKAAKATLSSASSGVGNAVAAPEVAADAVAFHGLAPPVVPRKFRRNRTRINEVLANAGSAYVGKTVTVAGWTRTNRNADKGRLLFIELNDGSTGTNLQCVLENGITEGFDECKASGGTGASFQITGEVVESPASGQDVELKASTAKCLGAVYGGNAQGTEVGGKLYPLSKKGQTLEHMRANAHLRPRTRIHAAAMRIRHSMAYATHKFFHDHGFLYIHTPIVTCADCEGAGEQFGVTTLLGADHHKPGVTLPIHEPPPPEEKAADGEGGEKKMSKSEMKRLKKQQEKAAKKKAAAAAAGGPPSHEENKVIGAIDYSKDFFARRANLTVSGQLNVETHACALSDVYTFGPTFRAENSHTYRHLAEFWMIEPEIAFADLSQDIDLAEDYLTYCAKYALECCKEDLEFFENNPHGEKGLTDRLKNVIAKPFKRMTYTEAIVLLQKAVKEDGVEFETEPVWGIDLPSEHERYICEKVYKQPVVLTDYPKDIKAFYMKLNDDEKTVAAADILVPKIGEIIGGSQREHRTDVLVRRCEEMGLDPRSVWWYVDLRKYGTVPHAGFGLGFERLLMFVTGLDNIRDVIPFPRWPGNADF